jgi:hypothetical protein
MKSFQKDGSQWRTQEIAKGGGGAFSRPRKVDDLFGGNYHLSTFFFFGERQLDDLFLLTDPNPTSIVSQSLKGGHLPVHLFSCLLQAVKNNFPSAKGGPWTPAPPLGTPLKAVMTHHKI